VVVLEEMSKKIQVEKRLIQKMPQGTEEEQEGRVLKAWFLHEAVKDRFKAGMERNGGRREKKEGGRKRSTFTFSESQQEMEGMGKWYERGREQRPRHHSESLEAWWGKL